MKEETTRSRDSSCGSQVTSSADSRIGAGAALVGVTTAALWATTHNEQCEAGELSPAKTS